MPKVDLNLIGQSVSGTPGTGNITLGSALPKLRALAATVDGITVDGNTVDVLLTDGDDQAVERDCLYTAPSTLARGTVESSTTGSRLSLTPAAQVRVIAAASRAAAWEAGGSYEVAIFADLIALSGVPTGRVYTVLGPVVTGGLPGIQFRKTSAGWTPAGDQVIYTLPSPVSGVTGGVAATTQMLGVAQLAVGLLRNVSRLFVTAKFNFSAADASFRQLSVRVGNSTTTPSGTGGEMAVGANVAAAARQASFGREVWFPTETTFQHADANAYAGANLINLASNTDPYQGFSTPNQTTQQVVLQACAVQAASPAATVTLQAFEVRIR